MKKSKFTEAQIVFALKQSDTGVRVDEICRKMGISEATFYAWKKKYGGLGVSELRELRQLKEENAKLKQMVADLSLDKHMLQDVLKKKFCSPFSARPSATISWTILISRCVAVARCCPSAPACITISLAVGRTSRCAVGSARLPSLGYDTGIGAFISSCVGRAGWIITSGYTGSTGRRGSTYVLSVPGG